MSLLTDIRGALQLRLDVIAGFPALERRAYEGRLFTPTNALYARLWLMSQSRRPFSLNDSQISGGLFQIDLLLPAKDSPGTATLETLMDATADAYPPKASLMQNATRLMINYAQPGPILPSADWLQGVVTVSWRCLNAS